MESGFLTLFGCFVVLFFIVWMLGFEIWDCFESLEVWFEEIEEIEEGGDAVWGRGRGWI